MGRKVYLDHAATTYTHPQVVEAMLPYFTEIYGNPSSIHSFGRDARKAMDAAREQTARVLGAEPSEIFFTGGGSEADNWAVKGVALANQGKGRHIITTAVEHHAVSHTCEYLEKMGFSVTYLPVDSDGLITADQVREAITDQTVLITVMFANNEIGSLMPVQEIGAVAKARGVLFHTDAVQAIGQVPVDVDAMNIDLLSLSGHKFYGPKGVGALYIRRGAKLHPFIHGGAQERNRRAGTENLPAIVGLGKAAELAHSNLETHSTRLAALRDKLIQGILGTVPHVRLNGHPVKRLPNNVNFSFEFIEGEALLLSLDLKGIAGSSGSACTSGSLDPSHVLLAIGLSHEIAHGSLRLTLGDQNTEEDVAYCLSVLPDIVSRLREMSPLFHQERGGQQFV